jgi:hypothetical protein
MTKRISILLALLAATSLACGSEDAARGDTGGGHHHAGPGEHDHFSQGMRRSTDQGLYEVAFYSDPAPPAVGENAFTLSIYEASGAPITGARVTVTPSMPSHGHGSDADPIVSEPGAGVYEVSNVMLQMMGVWQIDIEVETEAGLDLARFAFDVQ